MDPDFFSLFFFPLFYFILIFSNFSSRSGKSHGMIRSRSLTIDTSNETLAWHISVVLRSGERSTWLMVKLRHLNGSCGLLGVFCVSTAGTCCRRVGLESHAVTADGSLRP